MTERLTDEEQARVNAKRREAILAIRRRTAVLKGLAPARARLLEGESREQMVADLQLWFREFKESVEDQQHLEIVAGLKDMVLAYGEYMVAAERHRKAGGN